MPDENQPEKLPSTGPNRAKPAAKEKPESSERLQKLISRAGIASRRAAEELILSGKVSVNGHVITELGTRADPSMDRIVVEGKPLQMPSGKATVIVLHKPRGVMTTRSDPQGRQTVIDLLPRALRHLHPIGRLDFDTAGVLLLTDDGELTHGLTHPSHQIEKLYRARVRGKVEESTLSRLRRGVKIDDGTTAPCHIKVKNYTQNNTVLEVALREGRNRQVRRMMEAVGHAVSSLRRVAFAGIELEGLLPGEHRELLTVEVNQLRKQLEKPSRTRTAAQPRKPSSRKPGSTSENRTARAKPDSSRPTSARPTSARPTSARPTSARPTSARPTSARPSAKSSVAKSIERKWRQSG